jgi:hypothetical protein
MESTMGDVRPLINEQSATVKPGDDVSVQSLPQEFQTFVKQYGLTGTFNQTGQSSSSGEYGYNKGNVHNGFKEKINKNFEDNHINEKIKSAVDKLFNFT